MTVKLLTEHHLEFLRLTGACKGSSESKLVKMPHCWKLHAVAQIPYTQESMVKKWLCHDFEGHSEVNVGQIWVIVVVGGGASVFMWKHDKFDFVAS